MNAGIILAAGESRRMGSPKALLQYRGATFLDTLADLFAERCSPVIVVLGAKAEEIRAGSRARATFVVNADYAAGQFSSMRCGLRALPPRATGVLFTLVDHPAVSAATLDALLNQGGPELLRVPRFHGRRGHPIWFASRLIPEFLALPEDRSARDVVARHTAETAFLDLDDPGTVANIDDPAAYQALCGVRS